MEILIIIMLVIIIIYLYEKMHKVSENFDYNTTCTNCDNKSYFQCVNCKGCGVCVTKFGDSYCAKGDINGPAERTDCYKWLYGNIYPQYQEAYYDESLYAFPNDARFYPYKETLKEDGEKITKKEGFYAHFNNTLRPELYNR